MGRSEQTGRQGTGDVPPELLEPIEGVDLSLYARIARTQAEAALSESEFAAWLAARGLSRAQFEVASAGWIRRMREHVAVSATYGTIYQHVALD